VTQKNKIFILVWHRNQVKIKEHSRTDGTFPLLCTDPNLTTKQVLEAYKYQPRLEKRFTQFKSMHNAAPLLFKKIQRVEANMFAFFIALIIQALLEREIRQKMKSFKLESLSLYPEDRQAAHPTTAKVIKLFEELSTYTIKDSKNNTEQLKDSISPTQKKILKLLQINPEHYWNASAQPEANLTEK